MMESDFSPSTGTAMDALQKQGRAQIEAKMFESMMEDFIRRWSPEDPRERAEFAARLHSIVRKIYREAQEPVFNELHRLISMLPVYPLNQMIVK